jgi:hypothetical protein
MDEKREWTNFGSCKFRLLQAGARAEGYRLLAGPDDANQKGEADGGEDREGNKEALKEG